MGTMEHSKIVICTTCTLQFCILILLSNANVHQQIGVFESSSKIMQQQSSKLFEISSHPVKIIGAANLVSLLRSGRNSSVKIPAPINLRYKDVRFLPGTMESCSAGEDGPVDILVVIKSAVPNRSRRMLLRSMWANEAYLKTFDVTIKYAFILGLGNVPASSNDNSMARVMKEAKKHDDIIVADFIDTYRNLTYKTMSGFRWALESCPEFRYFVSLDDDVMLSIPNLLLFLRDPYKYPNVSYENSPSLGRILPHTEHLFLGKICEGNEVIRNPWSQYYVSPEAYSFPTFPPQISGFIVILSWETVSSFHHLASYVEHINVDDAFLGILANELRIKPLDTRDFADYRHPKPVALLDNPSLAKDFIALCCFFPQELFKFIWDGLYRS